MDQPPVDPEAMADDPASIAAAASLAASERRKREEEEDEIAEMEREVASLSRRSAALTSRARGLALSRAQLAATLQSTSEARLAAERAVDEAERRAEDEGEAAGGRRRGLRSMHALAKEAEQVDKAVSTTVVELAEAANQVQQLLTTGKVASQPTTSSAMGARSAMSTSASLASPSALPTMSAESMSALHDDGADAYAPLPGGRQFAAHAAAPNSVFSAGSGAPTSASPYALHHRALHAQYLALDDTWARTLNGLFRALFGGGDANGANGVHGQTVLLAQADLSARAEVESVIQATPHAKHTLARMRSMQSTLTPARGRLGAGATMRTAQKERPAIEEEPAGFRTPPPQSHAADQQQQASNGHVGVAPSSSLSASLHAQYSHELTRLYASFPGSQDHWLCHNLLFLGARARIAEQHAAMVREESVRSMTRPQLNEALAEVGVQVNTLTRQLAAVLNEADPNAMPTPPQGTGPGGFPALWHSLRSLQLLEVLRADLAFAHARQRAYLAAQTSLQQRLLQQRARHELLLALWRGEMRRVHEVKEVTGQCASELAGEVAKVVSRRGAYEHLRKLHDQTDTIQSPKRLTVDARSTFMQRAVRMATSVNTSLQRCGELGATSGTTSSSFSTTKTQQPVASFDGVLDTAHTLASFAPRFEAASRNEARTRTERMVALAASARQTRALLFDDGGDVRASSAASSTSPPGEASLARLRAHPFAQLEALATLRVESVTHGLNSLSQLYSQQLAAVEAGEDGTTTNAQAFVQPGDATTRYAWTEFIQAPDLLDERVAELKRRLAAVETR